MKRITLASFAFLVFFVAFANALTISSLQPDKYEVAELGIDDVYYVDRDYTIISMPAELEGAVWIMTGNDEKNSTGPVFISFDVDEAVTVYVGRDQRGDEEAGGAPPAWLSDEFEKTDGQIEVTDGNMGFFIVWSKNFPAGTVELGGNADVPAAGHGSNYVVLVASSGGTSVAPGGKLSAIWGSLKNE